jgi:predicted DNA-binding transcriptional regulator AlpA
MHDVVDKKVKVAVREGMEDRDRMDRTLLTASEVADTFSIAQRTLRYWRKRMPSFPRPLRFGRRLLFRRADIESYLAQQNPPAHKPAAAP